MKTWKVIHRRDNVETVYLVDADHGREATRACAEEVGGWVSTDFWSAVPFTASSPVKLYTFNRSNGDMS